MLDARHLADMRRELGEEVVPDLHALFAAETSAALLKLEAAEEIDRIGLMHSLKGSAQAMGMPRLALVCKEAETALREGREIDAAEFAQVLRQSSEAFVAECLGIRSGTRPVSDPR